MIIGDGALVADDELGGGGGDGSFGGVGGGGVGVRGFGGGGVGVRITSTEVSELDVDELDELLSRDKICGLLKMTFCIAGNIIKYYCHKLLPQSYLQCHMIPWDWWWGWGWSWNWRWCLWLGDGNFLLNNHFFR